MEQLLGYLPFLLFLACPLMMILCFAGMRGMGHSSSVATPVISAASLRELPPTEQIAHLQAQLANLRAEQDAISEQIRTVASDLADTTPDAGIGSASDIAVLARG